MAGNTAGYTPLRSVAEIKQINTPTEVDHYQIRRVIDIYVATRTEALNKVGKDINNLMANTKRDKNTRITMRGAAVSMNESFRDFGLGLLISIALVYLILMAQFASFIDPFIILMAIPAGACRGGDDPAVHRQHAQHHVFDGRDHDDGDRGFEQHLDC